MWSVVHITQMSDDQKDWINSPKFKNRQSCVMVTRPIYDNSTESIVIGALSEQNLAQAEVICRALNESGK